jgi:hypothetical protein
MLTAVANAANILKDARIIVEVLTDLLSAKTRDSMIFAVSPPPFVLFVAARVKEFRG